MSKSKGISGSRPYAAVLGSLVLLVASLAGGIVWYNSVKMSELAIVSTDRLVGEVGDKIVERVQLLYDPMVAIVALAARVPDLDAMVEGEDPPALRFLIRGLRAYPQIFSLYAGFEDGRFFMVTRLGGGERAAAREQLGAPVDTEFANERITVAPDGQRRVTWLFLDAAGKLIESRDDPGSTYDPRQRPWYSGARAAEGEVFRTRPYQFASSREMGVTLSRSIDGRLAGAFGADLAIGEVAQFLAEQRLSPETRVLVFDAAGTVVVHPGRLEGGGIKPVLPGTTIATLGDPVIAAAHARLAEAKQGGSLRLEVGGRDYIARIRPLPARYGTDEYLAIIVPAAEILAPVEAIRTQTLLYSTAFIVLALPLYGTLVIAWIDRRFAREAKELRWMTAANEEE